MRWASDWRIYYVAAAMFLMAGLIAFFSDGLGLRPVLGLVMSVAMALLGSKARKEGAGGLPPS
jgi:hypothetical protein